MQVEVGGQADTIVGNYEHFHFSKKENSVLLVHGAAKDKSPIDESLMLAQTLFRAQRIHSLSIHLRGVGHGVMKSGGCFNDSLEDKTQDILAGIIYLREMNPYNNFHIVASSMNAVTALLTLEKMFNIGINVESISLISPAAYPKGAELVRLGEEFSTIIRNPYKNLKSSPVFEIFERFNGRKLVAFGDSDSIIPREVQELYKQSADIVFTGRSDHNLGVTPTCPEFKLLYNLIAQMILST